MEQRTELEKMNDEEFKNFVCDFWNLKKFIRRHSYWKNQIFTRLSSNSDLFMAFIRSLPHHHTKQDIYFSEFPEEINRKFIEFALTNEENFKILANYEMFKLIITLYPDRKDELFTKILSNSDLFVTVFKTKKETNSAHPYNLKNAIISFPEYGEKIKNKFTEFVLMNDENFERLIIGYSDLQEIVALYPDNKDELLTKILLNPVLFITIFSPYELEQAIKFDFPDYAEKIELKFLALALSSEEAFKNLIRNQHGLEVITYLYPNRKNEFLTKILSNPRLFITIISSSHELEEAIKAFPEYAEKFETLIISEESIFNNFLRSYSSFEELLHNRLGYSCFEKIIALYPNHKDDFFARILSNSALFNNIILGPWALEEAIKNFPEYAEKIKHKFIEVGLTDEETSKRFIRDYETLKKVTALCHNYKDELLTKILSIPNFFAAVVHCIPENLKVFIEFFPGCNDKLLTKILSSPNLFAIMIRDSQDLRKAIEIFPDYTEKLIKLILTSEESFLDEFFRHSKFSEFKEIITLCPNHKEELFTKVVSSFDLFVPVFLGDRPDNFQKALQKAIENFSEYPEYAAILNLNIGILKSIIDRDHSAISNIHDSIKKAVINRIITFKTLQLFLSFLDTLPKDFNFENKVEVELKIENLHKNIGSYLEILKKAPRLAQLCANSLKQSGIIAKESEHTLQIHLIRDQKDLDLELEKLCDKEKTYIMENHKIILIKILKTEEWYFVGMNHKGKLKIEGPIPGNSELGETLLNTKIPISEEQKLPLLKQASRYLKTNIEELKLNLEPKNQSMFEENKPESINYNLSTSKSL